jgi:hypothetical protein
MGRKIPLSKLRQLDLLYWSQRTVQRITVQEKLIAMGVALGPKLKINHVLCVSDRRRRQNHSLNHLYCEYCGEEVEMEMSETE